MSDKNLNEWLFADIDDLIDCDYSDESEAENRMTDDEIIKTFECCIKDVNCEKCPAKDEDCFINRPQIALDLINRQKAEIERSKECPKCIYEYDGKTTEYCVQGPCSNFKTVEQIKTEAYKEFAVRLKCGVPQETGVIRCPDVDNLLKEMAGDTE